jgi:hypothetical protein
MWPARILERIREDLAGVAVLSSPNLRPVASWSCNAKAN